MLRRRRSAPSADPGPDADPLDPREEALETPHWQLGASTADDAPRHLLRRLPAAVRPVLRLIWEAAPRAAVTVAVLQIISGLATAFGLVATTDVLAELLAARPTGDRVLAALPGLLLVAGAFAVRGAMEIGVTHAQARITPTVRRLAEGQLYAGALRVELSAFDDAAFYDRMHRARDRGLFFLERAVGNLVELLGSLLGIIAAASSLAVLHPVLLPVLLLAVLPDGWAVQRAARLGYASAARAVVLDRRVQMVAELATERESAAEIRACQAEPFVLQEYRLVADPLRDEDIRLAVAQARVRGIGRALAGVGLGLTYATLGLLAWAGWIPLATAGTAVIAIRIATGALGQLVLAANQLAEQGLYIGDYQAFLAVTEEMAPQSRAARAADPGRVEVRDVGFSYLGGGAPALAGVSLTIERGQTIALVGENGSGKTTLAKLIAGLYTPTAGHIAWSGQDLRELDRASVADRVMMVLQEPVRWPHTARANVRVGRHDRPDPDAAYLRRAARQAGADDVVGRLPAGWETLLSSQFRGGLELSGGQWQRLAVARGLFRDAPLLIWDEPTAPLDAKAEFAVYESLRTLAADRTVVLITHRLSSVRHADRIFLLHEGRLAEQGTHEELLAHAGRYAELYHLQARLHASPLEA